MSSHCTYLQILHRLTHETHTQKKKNFFRWKISQKPTKSKENNANQRQRNIDEQNTMKRIDFMACFFIVDTKKLSSNLLKSVYRECVCVFVENSTVIQNRRSTRDKRPNIWLDVSKLQRNWTNIVKNTQTHTHRHTRSHFNPSMLYTFVLNHISFGFTFNTWNWHEYIEFIVYFWTSQRMTMCVCECLRLWMYMYGYACAQESKLYSFKWFRKGTL